MRKKIKKGLVVFIISGSLFFLFCPPVLPENPIGIPANGQEILGLVAKNDVIIIFNSGGWGNTPLEKAEDFAPVIDGIKQTLTDFGYNSLIVPYIRTKDDFLGKITGVKDFFSSFEFSSEDLAERIDNLADRFPDKKIILAGLSNGGAFVDETMKKISKEARNSVYAIAAGVPFWHDKAASENILYLDNNGRDSLAAGDIKLLVSSLFTQKDSVAIGHWYSWDSPQVGQEVVSFLESKLQIKQ